MIQILDTHKYYHAHHAVCIRYDKKCFPRDVDSSVMCANKLLPRCYYTIISIYGNRHVTWIWIEFTTCAAWPVLYYNCDTSMKWFFLWLLFDDIGHSNNQINCKKNQQERLYLHVCFETRTKKLFFLLVISNDQHCNLYKKSYFCQQPYPSKCWTYLSPDAIDLLYFNKVRAAILYLKNEGSKLFLHYFRILIYTNLIRMRLQKNIFFETSDELTYQFRTKTNL